MAGASLEKQQQYRGRKLSDISFCVCYIYLYIYYFHHFTFLSDSLFHGT